jgi:5-methylcytosine-specific restriction endonuclease McrA
MANLSLPAKRAARGFLIILAFILLPVAVFADQLEIRRSANVYAESNRDSAVVTRLDPSDRDGPYLVRLLDSEKVNGYYHIRVPGTVKDGWIYKTYVRRYDHPHPEYRPYSRSLYRHWVDEDGDCQDTRAEVLIRDASGPVVFTDERECKVQGGTWRDPYTGQVFRDPKKLDIDHVVPIKNAHESGGWAWSPIKRQEYANYLKYNKHLLAVMASENRKKSDKGPDKYLPPLDGFRCEYVKIWVKIKEDWELEMAESEGAAVQRILDECSNR